VEWASQFGLGSVSEVEYCGEKGRWEKHIGSYSVPGVTFKAHGFRFIGWLDGTLRVYLRIAASGLKLRPNSALATLQMGKDGKEAVFEIKSLADLGEVLEKTQRRD
jgi:hypothetical protein